MPEGLLALWARFCPDAPQPDACLVNLYRDGARMGLVGAPVMDAQGRMAGSVLSQATRRGLVFTSLPDDARSALAKTALGAQAQPEPIGADNYGRAADDLRRGLSVIQLVCLD